MTYNTKDLKNDFTKVVNSAIGISQPNKGFTCTQISKFFGDEIYKDSIIWKDLISLIMTDDEKSTLTKTSNKISRSLDFTNDLHHKVANSFGGCFYNEELRCIIHSIVSYKKSNLKNCYDVRGYTHRFIKDQGNNLYFLDNLKSFKRRISRASLLEFEIFENLIIQLLDENSPDMIFKIVKTITCD